MVGYGIYFKGIAGRTYTDGFDMGHEDRSREVGYILILSNWKNSSIIYRNQEDWKKKIKSSVNDVL